MQIPSGEGEEMVNSLLVTQGNFNSTSHGLAVVVNKIDLCKLDKGISEIWKKIKSQHLKMEF